eukprot:3060057-Amphidinium_carterae.1
MQWQQPPMKMGSDDMKAIDSIHSNIERGWSHLQGMAHSGSCSKKQLALWHLAAAETNTRTLWKLGW